MVPPPKFWAGELAGGTLNRANRPVLAILGELSHRAFAIGGHVRRHPVSVSWLLRIRLAPFT